MPLQINSKAVIDASFGVKRVVAMMLNNALVWQRSTRRLPIGYTELEWIESDGNQYFNTGIIGNLDTELYIKGTLIDTNPTANNFAQIAGTNRTSSRAVAINFNVRGSSATSRFGNRTAPNSYAVPLNTDFEAKINKDIYEYKDSHGTNISLTVGATTEFTTDGTMWIMYTNGGAYKVHSRMVSSYVKSAGVKLIDYVPCMRDSDGTIGAYDLVNGVFETNAGTGTFIAGPAKYLPSTYTEVEYIESTGTQYIDTGIIGKTGEYLIKTKVRTGNDISGLQSIYGVRKDSGNTRFMLGFYTSGGQVKFDFAINTDKFGQVVAKNTDYEFEADYRTATKTLKIDGVDDISSTDTLDTAGSTYLFGYNRMWQTESQMSSFFIGRAYTFEAIGLDNKHIANYVPCIRNSDGAVSMYDKVTNTFMPPKGTSAFIAGPAKALPSTYAEVEYIRSTGTQYISTNFYATNNSSVKIKFRRLNDDGNGIFGSRDTTAPKNAFLMWGAGAGFWRAQYGSQNFTSKVAKDTEWHVWEQRGTECFLDGKPFYIFTAETFRNTYEQILFGINSDPNTSKYLTETDIAYAQYGDSGVDYEDFKPCVRLQDNVAGFYNMITNEFVTNAGTGAFIAGPIKQ